MNSTRHLFPTAHLRLTTHIHCFCCVRPLHHEYTLDILHFVLKQEWRLLWLTPKMVFLTQDQ